MTSVLAVKYPSARDLSQSFVRHAASTTISTSVSPAPTILAISNTDPEVPALLRTLPPVLDNLKYIHTPLLKLVFLYRCLIVLQQSYLK